MGYDIRKKSKGFLWGIQKREFMHKLGLLVIFRLMQIAVTT